MLIRTFCTRDSIRGGGILSHSKYCSLKTSKLNERTSPSSLWNLNIRLSILHKHVQAQKNCRVFNLSYASFHKKFLTKKISLTSLQTEKHHFTYKIHWDPPVTQKSKRFEYSSKAQPPGIMKTKTSWHVFFLFPFELTNLVEEVQFTICCWHG